MNLKCKANHPITIAIIGVAEGNKEEISVSTFREVIRN
jgi:hypothetical protein